MNDYFTRHALRGTLIPDNPTEQLFLSIVIPAYNEDALLTCLLSLFKAERSKFPVEVIVMINFPENVSESVKLKSLAQQAQLQQWALKFSDDKLRFFILCEVLPKKDAGVGLARKIGMDEAARRFDLLKKDAGVIVCLDADCEVSVNYLVELEHHFLEKPETPAASIRFAHPFEKLSDAARDAIVMYEIFLRYYVNGLRYAGFPFAFQTIGSSMAVRNFAYQKQGGMNKRKAGEDFYFLQKVFPLGYFSEINSCCVYPSGRQSDRVPFGTGRAVGEILAGKEILFYDGVIFKYLRSLNELICDSGYRLDADELLKQLPEELAEFLRGIQFAQRISEIKENVRDASGFLKRFYRWFDGFLALKVVHFLSEKYFPRVPYNKLSHQEILAIDFSADPEKILLAFREKDIKYR